VDALGAAPARVPSPLRIRPVQHTMAGAECVR